MPTTHEYTLYHFHELSDDAKERALEACQDTNVDWPDWHEPTLEWQEEMLAAEGVESPEIQYRGFWSQGDGASFTGAIDLPAFMRAHKIAGKYRALYNSATEGYTTAEIVRVSSFYSHENTAKARVELRYRDTDTAAQCERLDAQAAAVEKIIEEWRYSRSQDIYKALSDEYEYQTSPEAVTETIEANEWQFSEDGTPEWKYPRI